MEKVKNVIPIFDLSAKRYHLDQSNFGLFIDISFFWKKYHNNFDLKNFDDYFNFEEQ